MKFTSHLPCRRRAEPSISRGAIRSGTASCFIAKNAGPKLTPNSKRRADPNGEEDAPLQSLPAPPRDARAASNGIVGAIAESESDWPIRVLKRTEYPAALRDLIAQLRQMPGVGPRSAERIALWMVQASPSQPEQIAAAISKQRATQIRPCTTLWLFRNGRALRNLPRRIRGRTSCSAWSSSRPIFFPWKKRALFAGAITH